ncbi:MAG: hypothetical protein PHW95_04275 [Patescibacteria group bacterium]|nr:hypothetical protein [Patescibacteria group bacterium]
MRRICFLLLAVLLFPLTALATPRYEIADVTAIDSSPLGILAQGWAPDGRHLAYMVDPSGANSLYVIDVTDLSTKRQVLGAGNTIARQSLAWSPNGEFVLFTSNNVGNLTISKVRVSDSSVTNLVLQPSDLGLDNATISVGDPCVVAPATGAAMVVATVNTVSGNSAGIWVIDVNNDGSVIAGTAKKLVDITDHLFVNPSVELSGDNTIDAVAMSERISSTVTKLWYVSSLTNVVSGSTPPVTSVADSKVSNFGVDGYHLGGIVSNDGSLVYSSKDVNGVFSDTDLSTLAASDFDLFVETYYNVLNHTPGAYRISLPGNQGSFSSAPGGTRLAYVTDLNGSSFPGALVLATLKVTDSVTLDGAGKVVDGCDIRDGSGTRFVIFGNTEIGGLANPGATSLDITMYTPVTPLQEIANVGITGTPVHRAFLPSGLTFTQSNAPVAPQVYIRYTDAEVAGLDENLLQLYEIGSDQMLRTVTVITRDPINNLIVGVVTGFSTYVVALPSQVDSDNDGWSDAAEATAGTDAHNALSHPDLGLVPYDMPLTDADHDLWSTQLENQQGTNPNNAGSHPDGNVVPQDITPPPDPVPMPTTSFVGLTLLAAMIIGLAITSIRKTRTTEG